MTTLKDKTMLTKTVTKGVGGTRIRVDRYELFRESILDALEGHDDGLTLKELGDDLRTRLASVEFNAGGSVTWYMMAVKLDLEARGLVERVPGVKPQRVRLQR